MSKELSKQQEVIESFVDSNHKNLKASFYESLLAQGLKRQLREERTVNKMLLLEIKELQGNVKVLQVQEAREEVKAF